MKTAKKIILGKKPYTQERNRKILEMLSQDKTPSQIANEFPLNIWTVRHCINSMVTNNGYQTLAALIADAVRLNLIC